MQSVSEWLSLHDTDGVTLSTKELLQYQSKTSLINLTPRKTIQAKLAGSYLAKTKGRGMEFDEARHYQPGDDIRAIDWRVTARSGKTHTKLYREEKERPIFVLADLSPSMHFGTQLLFKSVQVAHLAALIAWSARKRGDRIGGLIFNQHEHLEFKPLTRHKAVLSFLHGLIAMHKPDQLTPGDFTFSDACARIRRLAHPGSLVFVLSDFSGLNEAAKQHLSSISRHCELIAHPIHDPFEFELPDVALPQLVELTDGKDKQIISLGEKATAQQYSAAHQSYYEEKVKVLHQCKAQVLPISSAQPLQDQFVRRSGGRQ